MKTKAIAFAISTVAGSVYALNSHADNDFLIEEIVVTAEKRGAGRDLLEVGQAISAFTGDSMEAVGATSITDVLEMSPGVNLAQTARATSASIQIRGISSDFGDATVGYYLDDLPYTSVNTSFVPIVGTFDLEQIEVLRGPQGTLYGAGSSSGAVLVRTRNASTTDFEAKLDTSVSTTTEAGENYEVFGAVNVPLIDGVLGARIVAGYEDNAGYIDDVARGKDDYNDHRNDSVRAKLTYTPTDELTVRTSVWYSKTDAAPIFVNEDYKYDSPNLLFPIGTSEREALFDNNEYTLYNLSIEYDFPEVSLYSATSLIDLESESLNSTTTLLNDLWNRGETRSFNQEIRLASTHEGALQWTVGAFYQDSEEASDFLTVSQSSPSQVVQLVGDRYESEQWSVFGEMHYRFWEDRLEATVGLRYVDDEREADESALGNIAIASFFGVPTHRETGSSNVTPRFNLTAQWTDRAMSYINIAKGFRPGTQNSLTSVLFALGTEVVDPSADADELWTYEIGGKLRSEDDRFMVEAALYYNDWSDVQAFETIFISNPAAPGVNIPLLVGRNVGEAESYGLDLKLVYVPVNDLRLQFGGNVNNSEYKDSFGVQGGAIEAGTRIAQVPEYSLFASVDYNRPINDSLEWTLHLNLQKTAEKPTYFTGIEYQSDSNTLANFRTGVQSEQWGLFFYVDNLLNEDGLTTAVSSTLDPGVIGTRVKPRTAGLNLKYAY
ncbi:TonB-dependent receptor [Pseudomaricurvus alkylphenolicus]|uniref:TonB-dependent receptor n=1 Tax=Pseudomaricurvus alkylphenolicus TaxID=1306991 RepID=UPI001421CD24|nr:TonB-dependent receptor [Pseudomaricurvus alkylphenolicus]NIB38153.1 TonB-dependent receptor [Pseudomaricurvus alkylphenolicus]